MSYLDRYAIQMEQNRGSFMVVGIVIASLTFHFVINPPRGVWQADPKSAPAPS